MDNIYSSIFLSGRQVLSQQEEVENVQRVWVNQISAPRHLERGTELMAPGNCPPPWTLKEQQKNTMRHIVALADGAHLAPLELDAPGGGTGRGVFPARRGRRFSRQVAWNKNRQTRIGEFERLCVLQSQLILEFEQVLLALGGARWSLLPLFVSPSSPSTGSSRCCHIFCALLRTKRRVDSIKDHHSILIEDGT
jgi:hypothetical protein